MSKRASGSDSETVILNSYRQQWNVKINNIILTHSRQHWYQTKLYVYIDGYHTYSNVCLRILHLLNVWSFRLDVNYCMWTYSQLCATSVYYPTQWSSTVTILQSNFFEIRKTDASLSPSPHVTTTVIHGNLIIFIQGLS